MKRIHEDPVQLQRNRNENQFIELRLKSLIQIWVIFLLPTILVFCNNTIRIGALSNSGQNHNSTTGIVGTAI
jgi:hypothetical protein